MQVRWEGFAGDMPALQARLEALRRQAGVRAVLLLDSAGRLLTLTGVVPPLDLPSLVALLAADFCATRELARMVGEEDFHSVLHEGRAQSLYVTQIVEGAILVLMYDRDSTLGVVRYAVRRAHAGIARLVAAGWESEAHTAPRPDTDLPAAALQSFDRLFDTPA